MTQYIMSRFSYAITKSFKANRNKLCLFLWCYNHMRQFFVSSEASVTVASWISLNYRIRISECMLDKLAWMLFSHANKNISDRMPWMTCTKYYTKLEKKSRRTSNHLTIKLHHIIAMSYSLIFFFLLLCTLIQ